MFTETYLPSTDGVVTRLLATLREMARLRHEVLLLAPDGGPASYAGFRVEGFPGNPSFLYPDKRVIWPRPRVLRLVREFRPDIIHTVNPVVFGMGAIASARLLGVPLVASYHTHMPHFADLYGYPWAKGFVWWYMRLLHNRATLNLCTSESARRELVAHRFRRVRVWSHGVDTARFHRTPADAAMRMRLSGGHPDDLVLLCVARLAPEKQIERLLPVVRRAPGVRLALVGSGPLRERIEQAFAGTPTAFLGELLGDDLVAADNAADAFLFPSTKETLGLVRLEAMACGLPVIAARSAPSLDLLGEDEAGILYDADDPDALVCAVESFRDSQALRERLREGARRRGQQRGWEGPTHQLLVYYAEALGHVRAGARAPRLISGGTGAGGA
jgi:glycosyltransferase involved in cell wall biosynthesis